MIKYDATAKTFISLQILRMNVPKPYSKCHCVRTPGCNACIISNHIILAQRCVQCISCHREGYVQLGCPGRKEKCGQFRQQPPQPQVSEIHFTMRTYNFYFMDHLSI